MFRYIEELFLFILVFYIIKGFLKNLFPFFFKSSQSSSFKNQNNPFQNRNGGNPFGGSTDHSYTQTKPEGKIEVDYIPPKKEKKGGHFEGDFIDYEEIKK